MKKTLITFFTVLFCMTSSVGFSLDKFSDEKITCQIFKMKWCGVLGSKCHLGEVFPTDFISIDFKNKIYKSSNQTYSITNITSKKSNVIRTNINFGIGNSIIIQMNKWSIPGGETKLYDEPTLYNKKGFFKEVVVDQGFDLVWMRWGLCRF
jgi:hypothetical protein